MYNNVVIPFMNSRIETVFEIVKIPLKNQTPIVNVTHSQKSRLSAQL